VGVAFEYLQVRHTIVSCSHLLPSPASPERRARSRASAADRHPLPIPNLWAHEMVPPRIARPVTIPVAMLGTRAPA